MGQRSVSILHFFVWEGEESVSCFGLFRGWFREFSPRFPIHLHRCLRNPIYPLLMIFKLWTSCDKTWWMSWVCCRHRSSWYNFGSGLNPDSANQWIRLCCVEWRHDVTGRLHMCIIHGSCCGVLARCLCPSLGLAPWLNYGCRGVCSVYQIQSLNCSFWRGTRSTTYHSGCQSMNITLSQSTP